MPDFNLLDPTTWVAAQYRGITYWQLADLNAYAERFARDGNVTRTLLAVAWDDAEEFKRKALGEVTWNESNASLYLNRIGPLVCPYTDSQYLVDLEKHEIHAGLDATGRPMPAVPDVEVDNWFWLPADGAKFPPRIIYKAMFENLPYRVLDQDTFMGWGSNEQLRNVTKTRRVNPRERKIPGYTFETDDADATPVPEVGFIPYYDYQFTWTWVGVPEDAVPDTAIANCLVKANNNPFGFKRQPRNAGEVAGLYGKFQTADLLFEGLAREIAPYRGPNSEWLCDLPYIFRYQPADGAGSGMLKVPRNDGSWIKIRARGTAGSPKYMFLTANFEDLFRPGP